MSKRNAKSGISEQTWREIIKAVETYGFYLFGSGTGEPPDKATLADIAAHRPEIEAAKERFRNNGKKRKAKAKKPAKKRKMTPAEIDEAWRKYYEPVARQVAESEGRPLGKWYGMPWGYGKPYKVNYRGEPNSLSCTY